MTAKQCCTDGASLSLKADNGKFFCVVKDEVEVYDPDGSGEDLMATEYTSYVIPLKETSEDASCSFTVYKQADQTILLQASNGNYACRKGEGWGFEPIEADVSTPVSSCYFKVHNLPDGKVALQADNGKYLSRVLRGSFNQMEAHQQEINYFAKLTFYQSEN